MAIRTSSSGTAVLLLAVALTSALGACSRAERVPAPQRQAEAPPSPSPSAAESPTASPAALPVVLPTSDPAISDPPAPEPTTEPTPEPTPASETPADIPPPDNDPVTLKYWPGLKDIPSCRQNIKAVACAMDALHMGVPYPATDAAKSAVPRPSPSFPAGWGV